jgi:hypothetical protein
MGLGKFVDDFSVASISLVCQSALKIDPVGHF